MGKGVIKSHHGSGQYTVEVQVDRSDVDKQITELRSLIDKLDEIIDDPEASEEKVLYAKANKLSAEKRIRYLENPGKVPDNEDVTAWCADLTTDFSEGAEVGLIEIVREQKAGLNIFPGYDGNASYDPDRDGAIKPAMGLSAGGMYVSLGLLPGAQKWLPRYRYGTIESIDRQANTCTIDLSDISSSQQDLSINQTPTLSGVPFNYMDCDSAAFSEGDSVIVRFREYDWNQPEVIGFASNPQPCASYGILIISAPSGDEAFAWDIDTDSILVGKDTFSNVLDQLRDMGFSPAPSEALADGDMCHSGWADPPAETVCPWSNSDHFDRNVLNTGQEFRFYNPQNGAAMFRIFGEAFGETEDDRDKWYRTENGYVVFETLAGSTDINVIEISNGVPDGYDEPSFDKSYIEVLAGNVISETWTLYIFNRVYFYAKGETLGYLDDFLHDDRHYGHYPHTKYEHRGEDYGNIWSALELYGLKYNTREDGNHAVDAQGNIAAPYVYNWQGRAKSGNTAAVNTFESLTGDIWQDTSSYKYREKLFYAPVFAIHDTIHPSLAILGACSGNSGYTEMLDTWADCPWSGSLDEVPAIFSLAMGKKQTPAAALIFDAFSFRNDHTDQWTSGVHVYCRRGAAEVLSGAEFETFDLINQERTSRGLDALEFNLNLQEAAERHLQDMLDHYEEYADLIGTDDAHYGTDGSDWRERVKDAGYFIYFCLQGLYNNTAGENIGYTAEDEYSAEYMVEGWMDSPSHRENILHTEITDTGLAYGVAADGSHFVCQTFAYRLGKWPGYGPLSPDGINQYIADHFNWSGIGDDYRLPQIFLT